MTKSVKITFRGKEVEIPASEQEWFEAKIKAENPEVENKETEDNDSLENTKEDKKAAETKENKK